MKKFLLTAVVAVFALAANAQVWVGGSLGASMELFLLAEIVIALSQ